MRSRAVHIVCTIGPASRSPEVLRGLVDAGMNVARINFAHGTEAEHRENVARVRAASAEAGRPVAILQDLSGPKIRLGELIPPSVTLETGAQITLACGKDKGDAAHLPVPDEYLAAEARPGAPILLGDGAVELEVLDVDGADIHCRVVLGGPDLERQGRERARRRLVAADPRRARPARPRAGRGARRRPGRRVVRAERGRRLDRAPRAEAPGPALGSGREDRDQARAREPRGDPRARRRGDDRARRSLARDSVRARSDRAEADRAGGDPRRPAGDHRDADAAVDGERAASHPRRDHRRGERGARRHRRGDALRRDRRRRRSGARLPRDAADHRGDRRGVPAPERDADRRA